MSAPSYDSELLDALARAYAEAALDKLIAEAEDERRKAEDQAASLKAKNGGTRKRR